MNNTTSEWTELQASDGARIAAYRVKPSGKPRGGLVVVQEIFGVNAHIRSVADNFAAQGYEVLAPAFFDRAQPDFETSYDDAGITAGRALVSQIGFDKPLLDVAAAVAALSSAGKVGVVGYCWGGTIAYLSAVRVPGLSVAVGYYGGAIAKNAAERPRVPTLLHFGEHDKGIPLSDVELIRVQRPELDVRTYPAGHGFNCDARAAFDAPSRDLALSRTLGFFEQYLG